MNGDLKELSDKILKTCEEFPHGMSWKRFSDICGINYPDLPDDSDDSQIDEETVDAKIVWSSKRNRVKNKLNNYWIKEKMPYIIFNDQAGISILIKERDDAVHAEQVRIVDAISKRMEGIEIDFSMLKQVRDIRPKTRQSCDTISDGCRGLHMALLGLIPRLGLPAPARDNLIEKISVRLNLIDEDENEE